MKAILHGAAAEGRDVTTVIVWETAEAAKRYRESDLIREPLTLETELGMAFTRGGFAVTHHLD